MSCVLRNGWGAGRCRGVRLVRPEIGRSPRLEAHQTRSLALGLRAWATLCVRVQLGSTESSVASRSCRGEVGSGSRELPGREFPRSSVQGIAVSL
mgnify:FL=1